MTGSDKGPMWAYFHELPSVNKKHLRAWYLGPKYLDTATLSSSIERYTYFIISVTYFSRFVLIFGIQNIVEELWLPTPVHRKDLSRTRVNSSWCTDVGYICKIHPTKFRPAATKGAIKSVDQLDCLIARRPYYKSSEFARPVTARHRRRGRVFFTSTAILGLSHAYNHPRIHQRHLGVAKIEDSPPQR
ncbi:hypothetical protein B0H14DRAFT_2568488 [Mycena olivaceomarginata]|nr:hypothetical protein B0H14DRAFT_2568488 [Mycena olivaceomarginata]